jgi:hypothetical protein
VLMGRGRRSFAFRESLYQVCVANARDRAR